MSASGEKEIVDLRPDEDFPVFNQGNLGSCTANALAAAFHFTVHKMTVEDHADFRDFTPSRLFIYYNERYVEGFVRWDIGGMLRDGIKTMARVGVCPEKVWTYENIGEKFKQEFHDNRLEVLPCSPPCTFEEKEPERFPRLLGLSSGCICYR